MSQSVLPASQLSKMPLHAITETYGRDGLSERFRYEVASRFEGAEREQVDNAYIFASSLHSEDVRVREPYANHLLRVGIRMMSHYRVDDADVVSAMVLHDSVEDHAKDMVGYDVPAPKEQAIEMLAMRYNGRVASLVSGVTNPEFDESRDRNEQYLGHLALLVAAEDPWLSVMKNDDFADNATGLIYTTGPKVPKLAAKYLPAVPILRSSLQRPDLPLEPGVIQHIDEQLDLTKDRLKTLI